ncbi:MAG: 8-amino-7-oxononanoate synthase [Muribaculaceae bacterium]|nr:8-amino-7-oxononanoate synthase [Muribaculaceae bacterium]
MTAKKKTAVTTDSKGERAPRKKKVMKSKTPHVKTSPFACYEKMIQHFETENRLRHIPESRIETDEEYIDLLSNDYLGLGSEAKRYEDEFHHRFPDASFTSSASRLLSRNNKYHNLLENKLEELYGRPALLFNSGYHANMGVIQALAVEGTMFIADKLIHASAIDGLRLSGAVFKRFPHNEIKKAERLVKDNYDAYDRFVIIVEAIYSMDGDTAPLHRLVELKKKYPKVILYVDEAHSFGVRGNRGLGLAEEMGLLADIDIIIGTLGKAAASAGAFTVSSPILKEYLINCARSFIFSTAISPAQAAWSILMIEKIVVAGERRKYLAKISKELRKQIEERINIETPSSTQIIPIIIGDAGEAVNMARYLRENGFDTLAIRRPTVAAGSERIRLSLNAGVTKKEIKKLVTILEKYR